MDNKLNDLMGRVNNFNLTTNNILFENKNVDKLCTVSALAKYVGHVIHEMSTAALSILNEGLYSDLSITNRQIAPRIR